MTKAKPTVRRLRTPAIWQAAMVAVAFTAFGLAPRGALAQATDPPAKVGQEQARQTALLSVPGKVTDTAVERKRGKDVYVIEIVAAKDGAETDVLVDMETGTVIGIE